MVRASAEFQRPVSRWTEARGDGGQVASVKAVLADLTPFDPRLPARGSSGSRQSLTRDAWGRRSSVALTQATSASGVKGFSSNG
jgi:hypothetical protein